MKMLPLTTIQAKCGLPFKPHFKNLDAFKKAKDTVTPRL